MIGTQERVDDDVDGAGDNRQFIALLPQCVQRFDGAGHQWQLPDDREQVVAAFAALLPGVDVGLEPLGISDSTVQVVFVMAQAKILRYIERVMQCFPDVHGTVD